ncbi:MAG: TlpA family protein disulfide reductase [Bacteroidales bacterium]|nr:TlpA family protein disulfide reductase [Bacteroidales bacterium]
MSIVNLLRANGRLAATAPILLLALLLGGCGDGADSKPLAVEDFRGYTVFVNYWAEWCQPCREEIPDLNEFQQRHPDTVRVLGVNFDRLRGEALAAQEQALGVGFPTLEVDPRAQFGLPVPLGLPETFVIDAEGNLLDVLQGLQSLETLQAALEMARIQADEEEG